MRDGFHLLPLLALLVVLYWVDGGVVDIHGLLELLLPAVAQQGD